MIDERIWRQRIGIALVRSKRKYGVWSRIKRLNMEITNRCQANCIFCFREEFKKVPKRDIPLSKVIMCIDEVSDFSRKRFGGLNTINLGNNGEPLLHPDIVDIVSYASDKAKNVRVSTNLMLLNEDMSKQLLDAGLSRICFSVDEIEKSRFEAIRRNLSWETVYENAIRFKEIRDNGKYKCRIYINPVRCEENKDREKEIVSFWSKKMGTLVRMSDEIAIGVVDRVQPWFSIKEKPNCHDMVGVKSDGIITPCCFDIFGDYPLGDIFNEDFEEIFNGSAIKLLRYRLENISNIPNHCRICTALPQVVRVKRLNMA